MCYINMGVPGNDVDDVIPKSSFSIEMSGPAKLIKHRICAVRGQIWKWKSGYWYAINLGWGALLPNISTMCDSYAAMLNPSLLEFLVDWSSPTILSGSSVWTETLETYQFRAAAFLEAIDWISLRHPALTAWTSKACWRYGATNLCRMPCPCKPCSAIVDEENSYVLGRVWWWHIVDGLLALVRHYIIYHSTGLSDPQTLPNPFSSHDAFSDSDKH